MDQDVSSLRSEISELQDRLATLESQLAGLVDDDLPGEVVPEGGGENVTDTDRQESYRVTVNSENRVILSAGRRKIRGSDYVAFDAEVDAEQDLGAYVSGYSAWISLTYSTNVETPNPVWGIWQYGSTPTAENSTRAVEIYAVVGDAYTNRVWQRRLGDVILMDLGPCA